MLRKVLLVMLLILASSMVGQLFADYLVDFEGATETKTSYASGTVNLSGLDWDMTDALIGNSASDWKNGTKSARMRGYGASAMTMLADKANGIGILSFQYRRYGTEAQVDWKAEYSTNGGTDWIQIGSAFTAPASDVVQTFSETVNVTGNIRVRIKRATETGTSNNRLNIDDINVTDYTGGSTPTIYVTGSLSSFSTYTGTPSASQSYTLSGSNLTSNIIVTPPAGFALSTDDSNFGPSLSLANTFSGPVYVRLTGTSAGNFAGDITHTSGAATQVDLAASGTVTDPVPTINVTGTLNEFSTPVGTPSAAQTYTLSGVFLTADIGINAPAGFEVSTDGTIYDATASVASTFNGLIYIRLTGVTAGSYSGNIEHTSTGAAQVDLAATGTVTEPLGPTTFLEENVDYTLGTALTINGWTAHNLGGTNAILVTEPGLIYPDYPPALGYAATLSTSGEDIHRVYEPVATEGSVYASFLVKVTSAQTNGDYFFHLGTSPNNTSYYRGRVFIQKDEASNNFRFGISNAGGVTTAISTGYDYSYGTTYLVVVKYDIVPGTLNDAVYMWINPTISGTEPAPQLSTTDAITSEPTHIGSVALRQGTASNAPALVVDGIRITNDWALLWSGEAPPTPVISVTGTPDYLYSIAGSPTDPGEITSYNLSGENLVGSITVNAPEHFEVSSNGVDGWDSSISVGQSFDGPIYVRLNTATVGAHGGDITHNSSGADEVLLRVDGEALPPDVTWNITNNMGEFIATQGEDSNIQSYSLSASGASGNLSVSVTNGPFELSLDGANDWTSSMSLQPSFNGLVYVRMLSTVSGSFDGTILHTTANAADYPIQIHGTVNPPAGNYAVDLFFSEYIEGSRNNKALEIFNGTGVAVDMTPYKVYLYSNGSSTPGNTLTFSNTLAHGEVFVIVNDSANAAIQAQADVQSTVTYFNGDDALALVKVIEEVDYYVDIFGVIGFDPGTVWTADGGYSTAEKTLVRKPTVTQGISVNPVDTSFPTLGTEWDVYPQDTTSFLGSHTFTPGMEIAAAPVILPAGGVQSLPVNVTMNSSTPGAVIYYTLDGSVPTDASLNYNVTGSFSVSTTTTVKAITYATGYSPSSITEVEYIYPVIVANIADLRTRPTGTSNIYRLPTEAVLTFQQSTRNQKYIQDATAAIMIDDPAFVISTAYDLYDGITGITGYLSLYGETMLQFVPVANTAPATSYNNTVIPEVRTLASLTSADQAKLIKVVNATVDATNGNFGTYAENINTTDPTATLVMRTFPNTTYSGTVIPVDPVNITCLVGQYYANMQISPRFLTDFEPFVAGLLPPEQVTISQAGTQVTLQWQAVDGATGYIVEVSDMPYSGYTTLTTTTDPSHTFTMGTDAQRFYRVRATQ
jgi:hypothetical protein